VLNSVEVLDKGYVNLIDVMGDDLRVANAARKSFNVNHETLTDGDKSLIEDTLYKNGHSSPFRHSFATFEIKAPLMVARQWYKYIVGSDHVMDAWSETSRRYVSSEPEFYIPGEWRKQSSNKKQGSDGSLSAGKSMYLSYYADLVFKQAADDYNNALLMGVSTELARLFLPAYAMYTSWVWTGSLQSIMHFLEQRLNDDSQLEIQEYAWAVECLLRDIFPVSIGCVLEKLGINTDGKQNSTEKD
jgi:thymidylate synthase (FAD)